MVFNRIHCKRSLPKSRVSCCIAILIILSILMLLHFQFLPDWTHAYNDNCLLSPENKEDLLYLLKGLIHAFQRHNITYWLDYGTLLGATRHGGVIPWDGDGDISIIHPGESYDASRWSEELYEKGIRANMMVAYYGNMQVDIMRWKRYFANENNNNISYLYKYYPPSTKDSYIVKMHHKLESFPEAWVEPREVIDFNGTKAHVPFKWRKLLAKRYPMSLHFNMPYKWRCWLPQWMLSN